MSSNEIKFCDVCDRDVGVVSSGASTASKIFFYLGLVIPVWVVTLPICWSISGVLYLKQKKKLCSICNNQIDNETSKIKGKSEILSQEVKDAGEALDAMELMVHLTDNGFPLKKFNTITSGNAGEIISYLKSEEVTEFIKKSAPLLLVDMVEKEFSKVNLMFSGGRFCQDNGVDIKEYVSNYFGKDLSDKSKSTSVSSKIYNIQFYRNWDELNKSERKLLRTFSLLHAEKILNENEHLMYLNSLIWNDGNHRIDGIDNDELEEEVTLSIASNIAQDHCIPIADLINLVDNYFDKLSAFSKIYIGQLDRERVEKTENKKHILSIENYVTLNEFINHKNISKEKAIQMVSEGFCNGQYVEGEWYVHKTELK